MDRDGDPRLEQGRRAGGPLRVEVPGAEVGAPAPDRQKRKIQATAESLHAIEEIRVTGEVDPPGTVRQEPDRLGLGDGASGDSVGRFGGGDSDSLDLPRFS